MDYNEQSNDLIPIPESIPTKTLEYNGKSIMNFQDYQLPSIQYCIDNRFVNGDAQGRINASQQLTKGDFCVLMANMFTALMKRMGV